MDYAKPERADALAAQYVAGTLRGPARRRFEALLSSHPGLRGAVQRWQDRLLPLAAVLSPVQPPPRVWQAIQRRLWPAPATRPSAWRSLAWWRAATAFSLSAAIGLTFWLSAEGPAQAPVVVVLEATGAGLPDAPTGAQAAAPGRFVASFSADGRALVTRPLLPVTLAPERAFELWAVPPQGAPRSLGLISAQGLTVIKRAQLPQALLQGRTAALAVSVEPPGGSPTGAPTGPVVFAGKLQL